ncbi:zinc finger, CCHC-type containing protein [Tanacetum coccineum]
MDVKTTFLNGDLEEEVYMKQSGGFVMPGNEHKVYKLIKSLYGLKQAPKHWHQKFDEVVFSSGFLPNQSDKCVYSKLDDTGKGVIICLYVYDMLIFGTDQNQVDKTKEFLSSKFSMNDMGEVTTPIDPVEKLKPNTRKPVDQLKYSRAIGCLMYAIIRTRPDIAYAVGTMNHGLSYVGYPSVLEAYSYASLINHVEDSSFTSRWVFLLVGGVVSWASKKQSCITGSTIEFEFVALVAAGYFSEEYDEEREMEPRREQNRETTPPLHMRSPRVCRQREKVVGFEEALNREGGRLERNVEGDRPSELRARENGSQGMSIPPLLAAHLGRSENGQALQSSFTSIYGGHQPSFNIGGNLLLNGTHLLYNAQPFIPSSFHPSNGFRPAHVNSYSQPFMGIVNGQALNQPPQS